MRLVWTDPDDDEPDEFEWLEFGDPVGARRCTRRTA